MFQLLFKNKTLSLWLFLVISILAGLASWFSITLEAMPRENAENFLYLNISSAQIMAPSEQEKRLAMPVEGILRTLEGVSGFKTTVSQSSVTASVTYTNKTDMDRAYFDLLQSLQKLEEQQILNMKQVSITRLNPEAQAIIKLSISSMLEEYDLKRLLEQDLKSGIEAIPGMAKVEFAGLEQKVKTWNIPMDKLMGLKLKPETIAKRLDSREQAYSVGVWQAPSDQVVPVNAALAPTSIEQYFLTNLAEKGVLPLAEAFTPISDEAKGGGPLARKNLVKSVFIELFTKDGADLFKIKHDLVNYLRDFQKKGIVAEFLMDKVNDLNDSLNDVKSSLLMSILLTAFIVPLFLGRIKPALIIASIIPVSTLWTILLMFVMGKTLNLLTLSGLILSIGMVVDNGIIVMEKIEQLLEEGISRVDAAIKAAQDVFWPLLISTLTNASIFIPPTFVENGDPFTEMLKSFRDPIIYSLVTSFFSSLLIIPLITLSVKVGKEFKNDSKDFTPLFGWIYDNKLKLVIPIVLLVIFSIQPIKKLEESDIESPRDPFVGLRVRFSNDVPPIERREEFLKLEAAIYKLRKNYPLKFILAEFNPAYTNGSFSFFPTDNNHDEQLDQLVKFSEELVKTYPAPPGMVIGDQFNISIDPRPKFSLKFSANDTSSLDLLLEDLKQKVGAFEFIEQIKNDAEENDSHVAIFNLDRNKLMSKGLSASRVAQLSSKSDRVYAEFLSWIEGKQQMVRFMTQKEAEHWSLEDWGRHHLLAEKGPAINVQDLGRWVVRPQLTSIKRVNGMLSGQLHFYLPEGKNKKRDEVKNDILNFLKSYPFNDGQGLAKETSAINIENARKNSFFIIGLSIFLIYILLAAMFESLLVPISIMVSVPFAVIFGLLGLALFQLPVDPMARLGFVILTGIAVNNSIVLVDVINEWKARGFTRKDAIIKGCAQRFISVLMSTACNVAGVIPVALGQGKIMGIPYASMGIVIITGLLGSTIITLVLLPSLYEFLEDLGQRQGTAASEGAKSYPM